MSLLLDELEDLARTLPLGFCAKPDELIGRLMLVAHQHHNDPKHIEMLEMTLRRKSATGFYRDMRINAVGIHAIKTVGADKSLAIRTRDFELETARLFTDDLKAMLLVYIAQIMECHDEPRIIAKLCFNAIQYWWRIVHIDQPDQNVDKLMSYITYSCLNAESVTVSYPVKCRV